MILFFKHICKEGKTSFPTVTECVIEHITTWKQYIDFVKHQKYFGNYMDGCQKAKCQDSWLDLNKTKCWYFRLTIPLDILWNYKHQKKFSLHVAFGIFSSSLTTDYDWLLTKNILLRFALMNISSRFIKTNLICKYINPCQIDVSEFFSIPNCFC